MSWDQDFHQKWAIRLPSDVVDLISNPELRNQPGPGELREPAPTPEELIEPPGFPLDCPPDFFPLLGNGAGDFLCMRIGSDGAVSEYVLWRHDDWSEALAWGRSLAEALLLDFSLADPEDVSPETRTWSKWAGERLGNIDVRQSNLLDQLYRAGRCVEAIANARASAALWREEWSEVEQYARDVAAVRSNLAWPFLALAEVEERRGNLEDAARFSLKGIQQLERTVSFASRLSGDWSARVATIRERLKIDNPFLQAAGTPKRFGQVPALHDYWLEQALEAEEENRMLDAWDGYYRAVYHQRSEKAVLEEYLTMLGATAEKGGCEPWARLCRAMMPR